MLSVSDLARISDAFQHLSSSNDIPLDDEVLKLRQVLEEAKGTLRRQAGAHQEQSKDHAIQGNQSSEEVLKATAAEPSQVSEFITHHRSILLPIRRVPTEIVTEILLHTLSGDDWTAYPEIHDLCHGPWSYSCVSRHWRAVSLSLSQLWSEFVFDEVSADECPASPLSVLRLWMERLGNVPLRIYGQVMGSAAVPIYTAMIRLITAERHRWELFVWNEMPSHRQFCTSRDIMTSKTRPRQQLILDQLGGELWDGLNNSSIVLPHLRQYHVGGIIKTNLYHLIQAAPKLLELSLALHVTSRIHPSAPIMHTNIRQLDIAWGAFMIIRHLELPQLCTLKITTFDFEITSTFLRRSWCALELLHVRDPFPFDSRISLLLEVVPTLKHLILTWTHESIPTIDDLRHNAVNESLLTKLKIPKGTGPDRSDLVPLLETLSCELVDGHAELCVLLEMLESRCTTPHPLKTAKFWCSDDKCSDLRAALQALQLEVVIADGENLGTEIHML